MPDFCDGFENKIRSLSAITDLIGASAACRLFPDVPKQGTTLPFLVYAETGGESEEVLTGSAGMCRAVVHVWSFGATRSTANSLAETVRRQLRGEQNKRWGDLYITEVSCSQHREAGTDLPQDNRDQQRYWTKRIFDIWHEELV